MNVILSHFTYIWLKEQKSSPFFNFSTAVQDKNALLTSTFAFLLCITSKTTTNIPSIITEKEVETNGLNGEKLEITIIGTYDNKVASENKEITLVGSYKGVTGGNANKNNYTVTFANNKTTGSISKKLLSYTATAQGKVYDGTTNAVIKITELTGVVEGDNVTIEEEIEGTFVSSNKGTGIKVTTIKLFFRKNKEISCILDNLVIHY